VNLRVITAPAVEPVSLATAKLHLRVDGTDEDTLITSYIQSAREKGEAVSRRAFITQTLEVILDEWPDDLLALPRAPLQSVTSVKYLDEAGVEHTWTDYQVDARSTPGQLYFKSLPGGSLYPSGAIAIRFVAGYGSADTSVPQPIKNAILTAVAYWFEHREMIDLPAAARSQFWSLRAKWFEHG
jgi:uncharacterized phiE125 gp8 family phage protein